MRSLANPYADLRSLLDATRQLTEEEMAELHLEQGYVDRALHIYEELARREPTNATYAMRRAWLARMAAVRPVRRVGSREASAPPSEPSGPEPPARPRPEPTLRGVGPVRERPPVRAMRIVRVA